MGVTWTYAALAVLSVLHLLTLVYAHRGRNPDADTPAPDGDHVVCPACGVRNAADYRYCRACVAELPGGPVAWHDDGPRRRGVP